MATSCSTLPNARSWPLILDTGMKITSFPLFPSFHFTAFFFCRTLYRYDPRLRQQGKNPFQLDSKKIKTDLFKFLQADLRYAELMRSRPAEAKELQARLKQFNLDRFEALKEKAEGPAGAGAAEDPKGITILFGTETGTSEALASRLAASAKARSVATKVMGIDDYDFEKLASTKQTVSFILSTCGQGKFPANAEVSESLIVCFDSSSSSSSSHCHSFSFLAFFVTVIPTLFLIRHHHSLLIAILFVSLSFFLLVLSPLDAGFQ